MRLVDGGRITTVAGAVEPVNSSATSCGYGGDNGPATSAKLLEPTSAVPTTDGGFLISDYGNNRVRKVSSGGTITTVAGDGASGDTGNGGQATSASLQGPTAAVPVPGGGFLIGSLTNDSQKAVVRKVSATGTIATVAGIDTAVFTLSVARTGTGQGTVTSVPAGISCPTACSAGYASGTTVKLTATPSPGSVFAGWSGSGCGGTGSCSVAISANFAVSANFVPRPHVASPPSCSFGRGSGTVAISKKHGTGAFSVSLHCNQGARFALSGAVKAGRKSFALAKRTLTLRAAGTGSISLSVPKAAVTALRHRTKEKAVLKLVASNANGRSTTSATIPLKLARTKARAAVSRPG